jgi:hypothetical protein
VLGLGFHLPPPTQQSLPPSQGSFSKVSFLQENPPSLGRLAFIIEKGGALACSFVLPAFATSLSHFSSSTGD